MAGNRLGWQPPDRSELSERLKASAQREMTPREIWQQRVSFVYGNLMLDNRRITREMINKAATEIYGPCPE
jgi:hypothetical protein